MGDYRSVMKGPPVYSLADEVEDQERRLRLMERGLPRRQKVTLDNWMVDSIEEVRRHVGLPPSNRF